MIRPIRVAVVLGLLAVCGAAEAEPSVDGPLVLNGHLATSDFSGGVGDRSGASGDIYTTSYIFVRSSGRARAFIFAHASAHASAHAGGGHR
jgi:hypothetical protein